MKWGYSGNSFWEALRELEERWNNLEKGCSLPGANPQFYRWFCAHKAKDIVECVLPEVRSKAGLKDPCRDFTTNNSHVIKQEVNWKESKLPALVEHLRSTVDRHNAELQKAVVRRGEWQFTSQHQQLEVPESTWFQMPPECREKQMKKVLTCSVTSSQSSDKPAALISTSSSCTVPHTSESSSQFANSSMTFQESSQHDTPILPCGSTEQVSCGLLDVAVEDCGITTVSFTTLKNIWNKAERLVQANEAILKVPRSSDTKG